MTPAKKAIEKLLCIPCVKTFSLVSKSRSSFNVKVIFQRQGQIYRSHFSKNGVRQAFVFHKHTLLYDWIPCHLKTGLHVKFPFLKKASHTIAEVNTSNMFPSKRHLSTADFITKKSFVSNCFRVFFNFTYLSSNIWETIPPREEEWPTS